MYFLFGVNFPFKANREEMLQYDSGMIFFFSLQLWTVLCPGHLQGEELSTISQWMEPPPCTGKAGHMNVTHLKHQVMRGDPAWQTELQLSRRCAEVCSLLRPAPLSICISLYSSNTTSPFDLLLMTPDVSCSIPAAIPNGVITFAVMRPHGYKEKVRYACNEHYILDGEAEIQCQNTGNWSSMPVCRGECWEDHGTNQRLQFSIYTKAGRVCREILNSS